MNLTYTIKTTINLVPGAGVEPAQPIGRGILSPTDSTGLHLLTHRYTC